MESYVRSYFALRAERGAREHCNHLLLSTQKLSYSPVSCMLFDDAHISQRLTTPASFGEYTSRKVSKIYLFCI